MAIAKIGKLNFVITIISLVIVVLSFSNSYGEEDGKIKWGFSLSLGTDQKSKNDLTMYAFLPRVDLPFHKNWDLGFEGNFSFYRIKELKNLSLYRFEHISDPFKKDSGINTHVVNLGISF